MIRLDIPTLMWKGSYITIFEAMEKGLLDLKPNRLTNSIREVLGLSTLQNKKYTYIDIASEL